MTITLQQFTIQIKIIYIDKLYRPNICLDKKDQTNSLVQKDFFNIKSQKLNRPQNLSRSNYLDQKFVTSTSFLDQKLSTAKRIL